MLANWRSLTPSVGKQETGGWLVGSGARQAALRELLDIWDREGGPVPESEQAAARAAFDELDGLTDGRRTA
jgi:hypothetical protein